MMIDEGKEFQELSKNKAAGIEAHVTLGKDCIWGSVNGKGSRKPLRMSCTSLCDKIFLGNLKEKVYR